MLVLAMIIVFLTICRIEIKYSRWGKNSLGGEKSTRWARERPYTVLGQSCEIYNSIFVY